MLFFIQFILSLSFLVSPLFGTNADSPKQNLLFQEVYCDKKYEKEFQILLQLPQVQELASEIQQEGPFSIRKNTYISKQFEGYWDFDRRTILVTEGKSFANNLVTILFEMHNAKRDKDHTHLAHLAHRGQIKEADYVRKSEYIEYLNVQETCDLLDLGIDLGLFPKSAHWDMHTDFKSYFAQQKKTGHAKWHQDFFQKIAPKRGQKRLYG